MAYNFLPCDREQAYLLPSSLKDWLSRGGGQQALTMYLTVPQRQSLPWMLVAILVVAALGIRAEESDRVKAFLKTFRKAEGTGRVAAVQDLAKTWDAEVAETLLKLMRSKEDPDVLVAIVREAGLRTDEGGTAILKAALEMRGKKDDWRIRGTAAVTLIGRAAPGDLDLAVSAAGDKDDRVLQWLCDALATSPDAHAIGILKPFLEHQDWRLRAAAITALGHKTGSDEAAALLVDRLRSEDGRLVGDLLAALKKVTGKELGPDPKAWAQWATLRKTQEDASASGFDEIKGYGPPVTYHGVSSFSRRILFVFDRTGSMKRDDNLEKEKRHLIEAIEKLGEKADRKAAEDSYEKRKRPPPIFFNILMFSNGIVESWQTTLVSATEENKRAAISFVKKQQAIGWTNTWTAMKTALDMPGLDTIFLLSDGAPTDANGPADWKAVATQIRDYNKTKRIVIHTIAIGQAMESMDEFMQRIADENGGTYAKVP